MSNKTIRVRITNEELFALGFERVIYNGKEYVDKSPYSWILLAHFHKPIINWLRRKLTEQN